MPFTPKPQPCPGLLTGICDSSATDESLLPLYWLAVQGCGLGQGACGEEINADIHILHSSVLLFFNCFWANPIPKWHQHEAVGKLQTTFWMNWTTFSRVFQIACATEHMRMVLCWITYPGLIYQKHGILPLLLSRIEPCFFHEELVSSLNYVRYWSSIRHRLRNICPHHLTFSVPPVCSCVIWE